jgi:type I restriction enzyme S subunit
MTAEMTPYGLLPYDCSVAALADVCVKPAGVQTGPFGSQLHQSDYVSDGTPIVTVEHIGDNRLLTSNVPRVSVADYRRLQRFRLEVGDTVFSRVGAVDRSALVRDEEAGWLFSGRCLRVRPDPQLVDPAYLSWFLAMPEVKEYVRGIAVGATMPSLNTQLLADLPIWLPPIDRQRAIARIVGTLDDKIELNRRANMTLDRLARATFSRAVGRSTSTRLDSLVDLNPRRELTAGSRAPYVDMQALPTSGAEVRKAISKVFSSGSKFTDGDTLLARITPCLENGKTAFVDFLGEQTGWGSTEFIVMRPRPPLPDEYAYLLARSDQFRSHAIASMTGSSGRQRVQVAALAAYPAPVLSEDEASALRESVRPLFHLMRANEDESQTLTQLRNTLLGELIAGRIAVN